jgi:spoIIIJ-associated protein
MSEAPEPNPEGPEAEATGETVGEAKWSALRELERRFPGLDRETVEFAVLSEGERGLLGVGQVPARVIARATESPRTAPANPPESRQDESPLATRLRELLETICRSLGTPADIAIIESDESITASLSGRDLGLLIGKHGQTIDAIQYLANAVFLRGEAGKPVTVDAAGYRNRRQASLERAADRAADEALAAGRPISLEPMSAVERKIVHLRLRDRSDVETSSEGVEPNRFVVVRCAEPD